MPEKFEHDLLMELEGLTFLQSLFQGFDKMLAEFISEYTTLDPNLVVVLERIRYDVNLALNGTVQLDKIKVEGIIKQIDDVMDEVQVLQCGLKTKKGVPNEDVEEAEE